MYDAVFSRPLALPNAGATNYSDAWDLNVTAKLANQSNQWRQPQIHARVPALPDHTDSSKVNQLALQDSADGITFADTDPLVAVQIPGVASTGSAANLFKLSIPPGSRRYLRARQTVPAGGGTGANAVVEWDWYL